LKVIGDQVGAKQMLSAPETETSCAHEWRRPKGSKPASRAGCLSALQAFSHPDPDPEGQRLSLPAQLVSSLPPPPPSKVEHLSCRFSLLNELINLMLRYGRSLEDD